MTHAGHHAMHIEIVGDESFDQQARAYAEYRLFDALSHVIDADQVRHARLVLRRPTHKRNGDGVSCEVILEIRDADVLRIRATGDHPYAAINRAMDRITGNRTKRAS
jgi:ribosome-associated translation inhibitor RaiA